MSIQDLVKHLQGQHPQISHGGGKGGSINLSDKAKQLIAKRIKGIADFSRERNVTVVLNESALDDRGKPFISMIGSFEGSAKDFRGFSPEKLTDLKRNPQRVSDDLSINWYGKSKSIRKPIKETEL